MSIEKWDEYKKNFKEEALKSGKTEDYINHYLNYAEDLSKLNLPIIYNSKHFSSLVGINRSFLLTIGYGKKEFYKKFSIPKRDGSKRIINEPLPSLKIIQEWILKNILYFIPVSKFAKAYIPNKSIKENVRFHINQPIILKLDIKDFFHSISPYHIFNLFYSRGYEKKLSSLLTHLLTLNDGLPQGASTSPYLSNIIMEKFDQVVGEYCLKQFIRYTRYADDLTFSGNFNVQHLITLCDLELKKLGLRINYKKIRVLRENTSQQVTGIMVNKKIQAPYAYRNNIRLEIYYIKKFGISHHIKKQSFKGTTKEYLKSLLGKINYCLYLNPHDHQMDEYHGFIKSLLEEFKN